MTDASEIRRKKLNWVDVNYEGQDTLVVSGRFGAETKTSVIVTLERRKIRPVEKAADRDMPFINFYGKGANISEEEQEAIIIAKELDEFWNAQEGNTYSKLEKLIQEKTGSAEPEISTYFGVLRSLLRKQKSAY